MCCYNVAIYPWKFQLRDRHHLLPRVFQQWGRVVGRCFAPHTYHAVAQDISGTALERVDREVHLPRVAKLLQQECAIPVQLDPPQFAEMPGSRVAATEEELRDALTEMKKTADPVPVDVWRSEFATATGDEAAAAIGRMLVDRIA